KSENNVGMNTVLARFDDQYVGNFDIQISDSYDLIIVYGSWDDIKTYKVDEYDDCKKAKKFCNYIFYKMHNCKPFVTSGLTQGYKEEGSYPELKKNLENKIKKITLYPEQIGEELEVSEFVIAMVCTREDVIDILQCIPLF